MAGGLGGSAAELGSEVAVLEPVGVAFEAEDLGVVDEPVDHRGGGHVAEGLTPGRERLAGARFVELPGADHIFWFTNADLIAAETQEFLTGSRGVAGGARRLSTVLFTDVVGSTVRAGELGDSRWRDLLNSHDRLLRTNLLRYGGHEVKFVGDGVLALFDDPDSALQCAGALTSAVRGLGLEIRVGVHSGLVEMRDDDVAGMAVHIAARVMAAAGASQVLITRTMRDLLLGTDTQLAARGAYELKGIPEPMELFSLERG